jgi:hypothetical protein
MVGSGIGLNGSVKVGDRVFPDLNGKKKQSTQKPNLKGKYNLPNLNKFPNMNKFQNSKTQFQIFTKSKP